MSSFEPSRRVVVGLLAVLVIASAGCFEHPTTPDPVERPEPVVINVTPVTLGVAPASPRVHDTVVFSWTTPVASAMFDVCQRSRCFAATLAADGKSASFQPDESGEWTGTLRREVATPDLSATLASTKVVVSN